MCIRDRYDRGGDFRRICLSNELGDMELDEPELNYYDSKFKWWLEKW